MVSTPSIKIIYSSPLINFISIFLFLFVIAIAYKYTKIGMSVLSTRIFLAIFFFALIFNVYYVLMPKSFIGGENVFRYFYFFLSLFLVILCRNYINISLVTKLIVLWAIIISLLKITGNLHLRTALGQTYLTAGLPMGAGLTIIIFNIILRRWRNMFELSLNALALAIVSFGLILSQGRSNLIYPFAVLALYFLLTVSFSKKQRLKNVIVFALLACIISVAYMNLAESNEYMVFNRLNRVVESVEEESRYSIWAKTLDLILANPFGYGVDSYRYFLTNYPHNIFLEVTLSLGIIGLSFLGFLLYSFFKSLKNGIYMQQVYQNEILLGFISLYFFLAWNTSFDFATAYIPISMIILSSLKLGKFKIDYESIRNNSNVQQATGAKRRS